MSGPAAAVRFRWLVLLFSLAAGWLFLDLGSKHWVETRLLLGDRTSIGFGPVHVVRTFQLNRGGLFGAGADGAWSNLGLCGFAIIVVLAILYAVLLRCVFLDWILTVSLGSILGGTVGNLYDRVVLGGVRDFLYLEVPYVRCPIFNVADCALTLGLLLLFFAAMRTQSAGGPSLPECDSPCVQ